MLQSQIADLKLIAKHHFVAELNSIILKLYCQTPLLQNQTAEFKQSLLKLIQQYHKFMTNENN